MPIIKAAFADGAVAESLLRLLTEAWPASTAEVIARDEEMLCGWAAAMPHADFKMVLDTWRMHADPDREATTAQEQFDTRALHLSRLLDGVGVIDGKLDAEGFALVREAIRLYSHPADGESRTAAQRRAATIEYDALVAAPSSGDTTEARETVPGGVIDTDTDRTVVPSETIRRMACDCNVHRYITNPLGTVVDYGRSHRVVSDTLFDTLLIRDHGCRWAGCAIPARSCDAHHATHWLDDGETEPDNLVLLCWFHHHLLHEHHWSIEPLGGGHFSLNSPRGESQIIRPPLAGLALPTQPPLPLPLSFGIHDGG